MKQITFILLLAVRALLGTSACAQQQQASFSNCSAAFIDVKMIVNTYTPAGTCQLPAGATGDLTVQTVELSGLTAKPVDKIDFKVAIRDKATGTLHLFSDEVYRQISVQRVLATCQKGDRIVLLTVNKQYALPHNEILVQ
jgi:hypothetical protein